MDEKNKASKPKDLSDLKARLGLQKGARPAAGGTSPEPPPGARPAGSLVAPPVSASIPSAMPPSAAPAPAAPDARANPFAAMAASVQGAAAPAIVYRDDGKPVTQVRAAKWAGVVVTIAGGMIAGAILGYFFGGVSFDRANYNRMISDAQNIGTEVGTLAERLATIVEALKKSAQRTQNLAPDFVLVETLKAVDLQPPGQQKIFHTNYARLQDIAIDELFTYYYDTTALYRQIRSHVSLSEKEKELLNAYAQEAKTKEVNYGVVIEPGKVTTSKLVQVGSPICKGGKSECNNVNDLDGFMVSYSASSAPFAAHLGGAGIRVLPIEHTQMFDGLISGAKPEAIAANDYKRRMSQIRALVGELMAIQPNLLEHLKQAASKTKL